MIWQGSIARTMGSQWRTRVFKGWEFPGSGHLSRTSGAPWVAWDMTGGFTTGYLLMPLRGVEDFA